MSGDYDWQADDRFARVEEEANRLERELIQAENLIDRLSNDVAELQEENRGLRRELANWEGRGE